MEITKEKQQFDEISRLLLEYSQGNYRHKGSISDQASDLDMIISGINMLGEEVLSANVSRDFFTGIFNSVTDMVLVIDETGIILESNEAVIEKAGLLRQEINGMAVSDLLDGGRTTLFSEIVRSSDQIPYGHFEYNLYFPKQEKAVIGKFTCRRINLREADQYLVSICDITLERMNEQLILKSILEAQHREQRRVAADLHDSIGQELSMARLMISNIDRKKITDKPTLKLIEVCEDILDGGVAHLREICFDIMPGVLEKGGIVLAVKDLFGKLNCGETITASLKVQRKLPQLSKNIEIILFRIVQEFINNMIKHSAADKLNAEIRSDAKRDVVLTLTENGKGFDIAKIDQPGNNRGYPNIHSSVRAYGGKMKLDSSSKGTTLRVQFPLTKI